MQINVCEDLDSEAITDFCCCFRSNMYANPTLNIFVIDDEGSEKKLRGDAGHCGRLLSDLEGQNLNINSITELWCAITDWPLDGSVAVTTTCNHHVYYMKNCESTGILSPLIY